MPSSAFRVPVRQGSLDTALSPAWRATLLRHAVVAALALLLTLGFEQAFGDLPPERAWNRALADASVVLLGLTMLAGPLLHLARWKVLFALRRELGVWSAVAAIAHVAVVVGPWLRWERSALRPDAAVAMGNLVGAVALGYALVLAVTSNDWAQRRLGTSWTYLQRGALTCYVLVVLHTAYFLFLQPSDPAAPVAAWLRGPFLVGVVALLVVRTVTFLRVAARHARA